MKKSFLFSLLFVATSGFADELQHFDEIKSSVIVGKSIRIAIDFSQCTTSSSSSSKSATQDQYNIGVFSPNEIIVNSKGQIASSLTHFTLNNPSFPSKPVFEFVRYTITSDDSVNVITQVLDATNYTPLSNKISFDCKINTAAKIYS